MNLRQRILAGHLLLTALLAILAIYGAYRLQEAADGRRQGISSGKDLVSVNLLNLQVDEYFRLQRLWEDTHDVDFKNAAEEILRSALPVYSRLRTRLDGAGGPSRRAYGKLQELFAPLEKRRVPGSASSAPSSSMGPGRPGTLESSQKGTARPRATGGVTEGPPGGGSPPQTEPRPSGDGAKDPTSLAANGEPTGPEPERGVPPKRSDRAGGSPEVATTPSTGRDGSEGAAPVRVPSERGGPELGMDAPARGQAGGQSLPSPTSEKELKINRLALETRAEMAAMYDLLSKRLTGEAEAADRYARNADRAVLIVLLVSTPLAVLWSYLVIRSIRSGLDRLMDATEAVGHGKFNIDLPVSGNDEISRLSRAFNHMSAELEKARRLEADFLAVASHELKTPLACIQAYAQKVRATLERPPHGAEAAGYLDRIGEEVEHLVGKTSELLTLGVIEAGQLKLETREFVTKGFLLMAASAFQPIAAQKNVAFDIDISPQLPDTFIGDPDRLRQVLLNLLDNALKFTPARGRVAFAATIVDGALQIEVSDTGPGIPPGKLESIFDKYAQARSSPEEGRRGSGLGLAVARGIVLAHGGTIEAQSAPGQGSRFVVRLPVRRPGVQGKEVA